MRTQEQNYDKAVIDWVHSAQYKKRPLPCVFASPSRAFSQMERLLKERNSNMKTIPLPFASIQRVGDSFDPQRYNSGYHTNIAAEGDFSVFYGMQRPLPFTFTYQIDLWARLIQDLNDLQTQLLLRHRSNVIHLMVDHPSIPTPDLKDGPKQLSVSGIYRGLQEISEVAPGPREERILRHSLTYDIEGWRTFEADQYPVIDTIEVDSYVSEDLETEGEEIGSSTILGYVDYD